MRAVPVPEWFVLGTMPCLPHAEIVVWLHAFTLLSQGREYTTRAAATALGLSFRRVQMTIATLVGKQLLVAEHANGRPLRLALPPTAIADDRGLSPTAIADDRGLPRTAIADDRGLSPTAIADDRGSSPTTIADDRGSTSIRALSDGTSPATHASAVRSFNNLSGPVRTEEGSNIGSGVAANVDLLAPAVFGGRDFTGESIRDWIMVNFPASGAGGAGGWRQGQALRYVRPLLEVAAPEHGENGEPMLASFAELTAYLETKARDPRVLAGKIPIALACHEPLELRVWLVKRRRADAKAAQVVADRERAASSRAANVVTEVPLTAAAVGVLERLDASVKASASVSALRRGPVGVSKTQPGGEVPPPAPVTIPGLSRVGSGPSAPRRQ